MTKNTFKYYKDENGELKIEMTPDAARDVANYKAGFETCAMIAITDKPVRNLRMAENIAGTFLEDATWYEATKSEEFISDSSTIFGYEVFLNKLETKIGELLGWAQAAK